MPSAGHVEVDTAAFDQSMRRFLANVDRSSTDTAQETCSTIADNIRNHTPVLTGRLVGSVDVVRDKDGAAVTYGGGVPYAGKIERRTHAVANAVNSAAPTFTKAMQSMTDKEARRA